jgi:hypothetical protein
LRRIDSELERRLWHFEFRRNERQRLVGEREILVELEDRRDVGQVELEQRAVEE